MKYLGKIIVTVNLLLALSGCSNGELEPKQAFSKMDELINQTSIILEDVTDVKSAHQASKKITAIAEEYDETVLRIKPFERMSKTQASAIIKGFMRGRAIQNRLKVALNRIKQDSQIWLTLQSSILKLSASIKKGAIVMRSYIKALPIR